MTTTPIQKACTPVHNRKSVVPSGEWSQYFCRCRRSVVVVGLSPVVFTARTDLVSRQWTSGNNNISFYHFLSITVAFISTDGTVKTINQQHPWWSRSVCDPNILAPLSLTSSSTRPRTTALFDHGESVLMSLTIALYIVIILVLIIIIIIFFSLNRIIDFFSSVLLETSPSVSSRLTCMGRLNFVALQLWGNKLLNFLMVS